MRNPRDTAHPRAWSSWTLADGAVVVAVWACLFTMLSTHALSPYLVVAMEGVVPAYLLARLGRRWSRMELATTACFLAFMVWGAGRYFWPFPHRIRLPHQGYLSPLRERASYGLYAIYFAVLWISALRLSPSIPNAPETTVPPRFSRAATGIFTGVFATIIWTWILIAWLGPFEIPWKRTGTPLILLNGMTVALLASLLNCGDRGGSAPHGPRPGRIASVIVLIVLWGAAIGVRFVFPEATPANLLPGSMRFSITRMPPDKGPNSRRDSGGSPAPLGLSGDRRSTPDAAR